MSGHLDARVVEGRVLEIVESVARELTPEATHIQVGRDTSFDRDLGLDSLGRVEAATRVAAAFGVELPPDAFAEVETPADLARAVLAADPARPVDAAPPTLEPRDDDAAVPTHLRTLGEILEWQARRRPDQVFLTLLDERPEQPVTYREMFDEARKVAAGLRAHGVAPGDAVPIILPSGREYFQAFWGALFAGAIPAPLYPPVRKNQLGEHLTRQAAIVRNCDAKVLVTVPEAASLGLLLKGQAPNLQSVLPVSKLLEAGTDLRGIPHRCDPDDLALLQYTSGSTGTPKGVQLSHADLLVNIKAFCQSVGADPVEDRFVSWLPLYHDLGLIGACLGTFYMGIPLYLMSPLSFLARPARWLEEMTRRKATLTAGPNFAYQLCVQKVDDETFAKLDLSSWRVTVNGAEPIDPAGLERFAERFGPVGYKPEVMTPAYGMAELALGLTCTPHGVRPRVDRIEREAFTTRAEAVPAAADDPDAISFVGCGPPMQGYAVRILGPDGDELPERHEGELVYQGPSATRGYLRNEEATRGLIREDGWRVSGDRAYLADGWVYVTGRVKDLIIKRGRNLTPHEIEEAAARVEGVRKGCVAAFGARKAGDSTERLVVLAETREQGRETRERIEAGIRQAVHDAVGLPPDEVVLAPPGSVLKTSSGKLRRAACRQRYEAGDATRGAASVPRQMLGPALAAARGWIGRSLRGVSSTAYAGWFWFWFLTTGAISWLGVALFPTAWLRWRWTKAWTTLFCRLVGVSLRIEGAELLPRDEPSIVVLNHQSYLDAVVVLATSVAPGRFAAKKELQTGGLIPRVFFGRLGAFFVERNDKARAVDDLDAIRGEVAGGPIAFFAEGTFQRTPGLLPFRLGAFRLATEAQVPVVPVAIAGTRRVLEPDQWWPRPGPVTLTVCERLRPDGDDLAAAARLRSSTRKAILAHCGEPDLG